MQIRPRSLHLSLVIILLSASCSTKPNTLKDFSSDGCSLFPDRSLLTNTDWCECCLEHDMAYWQGGTKEQRLEADRKLRNCILTKTGNATLARTMYQGVRLGGSPWFYTWYRWGYGWNYGRGYKALTLEEQRLASDKLVDYFENSADRSNPCK